MPLLGYLLGSRFIRYMARVDHIIALLLLGYLGGRGHSPVIYNLFTLFRAL